jgi:hypothetical protein
VHWQILSQFLIWGEEPYEFYSENYTEEAQFGKVTFLSNGTGHYYTPMGFPDNPFTWSLSGNSLIFGSNDVRHTVDERTATSFVMTSTIHIDMFGGFDNFSTTTFKLVPFNYWAWGKPGVSEPPKVKETIPVEEGLGVTWEIPVEDDEEKDYYVVVDDQWYSAYDAGDVESEETAGSVAIVDGNVETTGTVLRIDIGPEEEDVENRSLSGELRSAGDTAVSRTKTRRAVPATRSTAVRPVSVILTGVVEGRAYNVQIAAVNNIEIDAEKGINASIVGLSDAQPVTVVGNEEVTDVKPFFRVTGTDGRLHVTTDKAGEVTIYTSSGQLVRRQPVGCGTTSIPVSPGLYVVVFGDTTVKVVVR